MIDLYRFKRELEDLEKKRGRGTELISVYIPPGRPISEVMSHMRQEQSSASNIKSKSTRKNVISALEVIMQRLKLIRKVPENGLVIFAGVVPKNGGGEKMETHLIVPPEPINLYLYHCDSKFYLEPLKEMLKEKEVYGIILLDRREATIALLKGKRFEILKRLTSGVPGKIKAGGQSSRRFQRLIEQAAYEFLVRIGEHSSRIFMEIPEIKGIIIGGPGPTKEKFFEGDFLHHELKKKVVAVVDTGYTGEDGIRELIDRATGKLQELSIVKQRKLFQRFLKEVVKGTGLATYGVREVMDALEKGLVDTLLISEGLEIKFIRGKCDSCNEKIEGIFMESPKCKCGGSLNIEEERDLVEEMIEKAEATGAEIEVLPEDTEEGAQLKNFGGVAAILRFAG